MCLSVPHVPLIAHATIARVAVSHADCAFWCGQSQLAKLMAKQMVEPKRKTIDVEKIWLDKRAEKGSGPGGMLCLTLVQARDLW